SRAKIVVARSFILPECRRDRAKDRNFWNDDLNAASFPSDTAGAADWQPGLLPLQLADPLHHGYERSRSNYSPVKKSFGTSLPRRGLWWTDGKQREPCGSLSRKDASCSRRHTERRNNTGGARLTNAGSTRKWRRIDLN